MTTVPLKICAQTSKYFRAKYFLCAEGYIILIRTNLTELHLLLSEAIQRNLSDRRKVFAHIASLIAENRCKMQYFVECKDTSLCIIYEKSIILEKHNSTLEIGEKVSFLWPEDNLKAKKFVGKIVDKNGKLYVNIYYIHIIILTYFIDVNQYPFLCHVFVLSYPHSCRIAV